MNMIGIVNEAINRKLNSISFTNIIVGTVESVKPLQIRINSRILIGQSFIEPMSLGINDYSPNSALPLVVGEKIQMVRYNNGQRFYVLGKSVSSSTIKVDYETQVYNKPILKATAEEMLDPIVEPIDGEVILHKVTRTGCYNDVCNKPKLNTNNTKSLAVNSAEEIKDTISLHKVAKTGSYKDLLDQPTIPVVPLTNPVFNWERTGDTVTYIKIAEMDTDINNGINNFQAEINGNSNFGNNLTGTDFIQCSTRNSVGLTVNRINVGYDVLTYGYVNNSDTGKTEIWIKVGRYNYRINMVVTNISNCTYGKLAYQTTEPTGIVYITPKVLTTKDYVDTNFLQFDVIEEF